jgi:hypothetical protein
MQGKYHGTYVYVRKTHVVLMCAWYHGTRTYTCTMVPMVRGIAMRTCVRTYVRTMVRTSTCTMVPGIAIHVYVRTYTCTPWYTCTLPTMCTS